MHGHAKVSDAQASEMIVPCVASFKLGGQLSSRHGVESSTILALPFDQHNDVTVFYLGVATLKMA